MSSNDQNESIELNVFTSTPISSGTLKRRTPGFNRKTAVANLRTWISIQSSLASDGFEETYREVLLISFWIWVMALTEVLEENLKTKNEDMEDLNAFELRNVIVPIEPKTPELGVAAYRNDPSLPIKNLSEFDENLNIFARFCKCVWQWILEAFERFYWRVWQWLLVVNEIIMEYYQFVLEPTYIQNRATRPSHMRESTPPFTRVFFRDGNYTMPCPSPIREELEDDDNLNFLERFLKLLYRFERYPNDYPITLHFVKLFAYVSGWLMNYFSYDLKFCSNIMIERYLCSKMVKTIFILNSSSTSDTSSQCDDDDEQG
ncbi:hypothetical protein BLOT_011450 [Blomia tropicalis]|nr:hypothetical protein BLOT_011450 [Blomia tropicalis]